MGGLDEDVVVMVGKEGSTGNSRRQCRGARGRWSGGLVPHVRRGESDAVHMLVKLSSRMF